MRQKDLFRELIIDNFAGGGGASEGISQALGRSVDIAINHDPAAIAMHRANHPDTYHYCENVWDVDPRQVTNGRPVALVWLSPDCKHFSKAKGGKPVEKSIRGLAWVAVRWAATVKPRVIMLENVEEFKTWGPLLKDGMPDKKQKGRTFNCFINALKRQGYQVDFRELRACDYGAPTTRKRFFMTARRDGQQIVWPEPTHGDPKSMAVIGGKLKPWRTAAEIIDWSLPCPSIFERKKPLAENTLRRIARGIQKFVVDNPEPFIMQAFGGGYTGTGSNINNPLPTVTAKDHNYLVSPYLTRIGQQGFGGDKMQYPLDKPLTTITTKAEHLLVAPFLTQYHGYEGDGARGQTMDRPLLTLDTSNRYALVSAFIDRQFGKSTGNSIDAPLGTIMAGGGGKSQLVRAFLTTYYGTGVGNKLTDPLPTVVSKDRFGLVVVGGLDYQISDIGMRMLAPRELFNAQGFPKDYIIERDYKGNIYSKTAQVARCGNSVSPVIPLALVRANLPDQCYAEQVS